MRDTSRSPAWARWEVMTLDPLPWSVANRIDEPLEAFPAWLAAAFTAIDTTAAAA